MPIKRGTITHLRGSLNIRTVQLMKSKLANGFILSLKAMVAIGNFLQSFDVMGPVDRIQSSLYSLFLNGRSQKCDEDYNSEDRNIQAI